MSGRTIAIGDIHGCHVALEKIIEAIEPTAEDEIVCLGDVIDRGPGTRQSIEQLLQLQQQCRLVFILGNHEEMMLDVADGYAAPGFWLSVGGQEMLDSYNADNLAGVDESHIEFLRAGVPYHEVAGTIFVHASVDPDLPMDQQEMSTLRWQRMTGHERPHRSGKLVVCGHTSLKGGVPLILPGWVNIDTWAYGGQSLTALDCTGSLVYQARQDGQVSPPRPLADFED